MADNTTVNATVGAQVGGVVNATANANGAGQSAVGNEPAGGANQTQAQGNRSYTQEEFESELERRVQQGINTAREKWAAEFNIKLNEAKSEGEKLAKMTAEQRAKAEFEQQKQSFENERAKYQAERLEFEAAKQLGEQNLPISFAKMCVGKDAEETKSNIEAFKKEWNDALQSAVDSRMKGTTPKASGGTGTSGTAAGFLDIINELHR